MRATITLDVDVAARLLKSVHRSGISLKRAAGDAVRDGLT